MVSRDMDSGVTAPVGAEQTDIVERLDILGGNLVIANRYLRLITIALFLLLGLAVLALVAALAT